MKLEKNLNNINNNIFNNDIFYLKFSIYILFNIINSII